MAKAVIDLAEIDTAAGKHWLHPSQKLRSSERAHAIRAKHRAKHDAEHRAECEMRRAVKKAGKISGKLDRLDDQ